ncbi:MAG: aminopeptidase P family protein [Flavitalea sp.]
MINTNTYLQRRAALKAKAGKGILVFLGNDQVGMNYRDNWYHFRQDSTFLYFTGLDLAGLALVIDIDSDTETLYGNDATVDDIVWQGPVPTIKELAATAGITKTAPLADLKNVFNPVSLPVISYLPPYRADHYIWLQQLTGYSDAEIDAKVSVPLIKAVVALRSVKSADEITEIGKAVNVTNAMQLKAMHYAKAGMTEAEIAGQLQAVAIAGGGDLSFPTILTTKGETLHIHYTSNIVEAGKLLLVDCGAELHNRYPGDLTRTFPVDKTFTSLQKDVYNIVLNAQQSAADALKPGIRYIDVHLLAAEKLVDGLKELGLMKGDSKEAVANHAHTLFFQCGLGHMLGLDIHDMENLGEKYVGYSEEMEKSKIFGLKSLRLARKLEPGFVLTVEPGLYFIPTLMDIWKKENKLSQFINYDKLDRFRNFSGIRIEENYAITDNGAQLLGEPLVKDVAGIEEIRRQVLS